MFFIVSFVVVLISLFIAYYTEERWLIIKGLVNSITAGLEFNTWVFIISFLVVIFLEIFNAIQCGFLGIILGNKKNNNKTGFSVLFGFIAYLLSQSLVLCLMFVIGLFDSSIMDLFKNNIILSNHSFKLLIVLAIVLYLVIITLMNLLCKKELNKGVDVE